MSKSLRRCRPLLGTYVEITIPAGACDGDPLVAIESAYAAVAQVQRSMSFHEPGSDLSRINAARPGDTLRVDPWTVEVLALAGKLHRVSGGLFDCGAATAGGPRGGSVLCVEARGGSEVRIHAAVRLDLGGIAKGFAVDRAVDALANAGVRNAVVNAGGDLRVLGDQPFSLHVRCPQVPAELVYVGDLADGAAATSATYFTRAALVDPLTQRAVEDKRSFTVLAPLCAVADGLTKVLAVAGVLSPACLSCFDARAVVL